MGRILEYYVLIGVVSVAAICMLYVVLLPLPNMRVLATDHITSTPLVAHVKFAKSGIPVRLVVPTIGIDMPVSVGEFNPNTKLWTISDNQIFYANNSVPANDTNGTTVIYGHDRWGVFGVLPDLQLGSFARVHTDSGLHFEYQLSAVRIVNPTDTSIFTESGTSKLALQTCTGPWDAQRALYVFDFVGEV